MLKYPDMVEQVQKSILQTGFEVLDKENPTEDFLDKKGLTEEQEQINVTITNLRKNIAAFMKFSDPKSRDRWTDLKLRPGRLFDATRVITEKINNTQLKNTLIGNDVINIIATARHLLIVESIEKQRKLAIDNDCYSGWLQEHERISNFDTNGNLFMKIGGTSILDLFRKKDITPVEYFNCLINAWLTRGQSNYDQVLSENNNELTTHYPNTAKQQVQESCGQILCITNLASEHANEIFDRSIIPNISPLESLDEEIIQKAKSVIERMNVLEQKTFETILNPASPFFPALKEKLENCLNNESPIVRTFALQRLGLKTKSQIKKAYRESRKLASEDKEYSPFYERLSNYIKKYFVEENPVKTNFFTESNMPTFLNEMNADKVVPTFEDLRRIKMAILQKSSKSEYNIDPSLIDWQRLISPSAVIVKFHEDLPHKSTIVFVYGKNGNKNTMLFLEINTQSKKAGIDWNFLEDPNSTEMEGMKNAALLSAKSILLSLLRQTEIEYENKQNTRITSTIAQTTEDSPVEKRKQWIPREKFKKPKPKPLNIVDRLLQGPALSLTKASRNSRGYRYYPNGRYSQEKSE
jgi:hypothetical protein